MSRGKFNFCEARTFRLSRTPSKSVANGASQIDRSIPPFLSSLSCSRMASEGIIGTRRLGAVIILRERSAILRDVAARHQPLHHGFIQLHDVGVVVLRRPAPVPPPHEPELRSKRGGWTRRRAWGGTTRNRRRDVGVNGRGGGEREALQGRHGEVARLEEKRVAGLPGAVCRAKVSSAGSRHIWGGGAPSLRASSAATTIQMAMRRTSSSRACRRRRSWHLREEFTRYELWSDNEDVNPVRDRQLCAPERRELVLGEIEGKGWDAVEEMNLREVGRVAERLQIQAFQVGPRQFGVEEVAWQLAPEPEVIGADGRRKVNGNVPLPMGPGHQGREESLESIVVVRLEPEVGFQVVQLDAAASGARQLSTTINGGVERDAAPMRADSRGNNWRAMDRDPADSQEKYASGLRRGVYECEDSLTSGRRGEGVSSRCPNRQRPSDVSIARVVEAELHERSG
ncbi:hypothetical protein C8J57DRAFT_1460296 [Mycena rebaudengoi]|nr:hypothetical protein C8J57DRAFT_1460296 [Mycena rebaudengoi]